ncbi:MAG TPA: uroporphyrinogen-III C-methyltransferase [Vicinamibacterales bacterium]|nr:uroporphyrinogen-III C-methyltransferase [Vicinamibacterales bacterium]
MTSSVRGFVSLVGAGPGDPGLLTRAALARLRRADLVLFDALVDPDIVRRARRARRFFVGKRAGRPSIAQETIHALMIRAARRGQRVVRLKGGDPFVFGRGGEEALALRAANVPYEVIPGISSALAAPALAGIPVTHRGTARAFTVIAGHAPASYEPVLDAIAPAAMTLVFLMALGRQREIAQALIARGWRASTPAAVLLSASRAEAEEWFGSIASLAAGDGPAEAGRPGMIVVGDVVAVSLQLRAPSALAVGGAR